MERDQAIKVGVASLVLLVAVVLIAMNLMGKKTPKGTAADQPPPPPTQRSGGGRMAPGAKK